MMKNILFILLFCFFKAFVSISQSDKVYTILSSIEPEFTDNNDLKSLDSIFVNRKIIGMGESTHGTSEFTTMRHRFFKYLVEKHGYNTFFLEADFAACQRVNRYINGETDSIKDVLSEIRLWPWRTEEMVVFIEWMRKHNLNQDNKITFVGCDMQLIEDDFLELERFFQRVSPNNTFQLSILESSKQPFEKSLIVEEKTKWYNFTSTYKKDQLPPAELINYTMMKQGIDQWFDYNLSLTPSYNFRDSCMAANIITYLNLNSYAKGFYFAHNFHVSKAIHRYKGKKYYDKKSTGRYLFEHYNTSYYSILQDINQGKTNAYNFHDKKYNFEVFDLEPSKAKSISHYYNKYNIPILFSSQIPSIKNMQITQIGAVYGRDGDQRKIYRYSLYAKEYFDAYLFIRDGHPSKVIWN